MKFILLLTVLYSSIFAFTQYDVKFNKYYTEFKVINKKNTFDCNTEFLVVNRSTIYCIKK